MPGLILPKPFHKLLVVGPLYDKTDKLARVEEMIPEYDWTIFNSGLCYPYDDIEQVRNRINKMKRLITAGKVIYLAGRLDYLLMNNLKDSDLANWIRGCYNIVIANFSSRNVVITDGGIPTNIKSQKELADNLEVSFVSHIKENPWHKSYSGSLGYVISNNPLTDQPPRHYNYSMRLGNFYNANSHVYAQEVDEIGLKKTITL